MKKKLGFILILTVLILAFALVGCTETYQQEAIPGDYATLSVEQESGLATKVTMGGKSYLYFVNGVAGQTIEDNTFGSVVKGAIARVELAANGSPILSTRRIIVPKNIFATDVESSFVIRGGYLYYTTPSVVKDKAGAAKTSDMVLMRTSLDGTATEIIKTFPSDEGGFSNVLRVTEKEVVYYYQNTFKRIDLTSKKFDETTVVEKVSAYKFIKGADYAVYTVTPEDSDFANQVCLLPFSATSADQTKVLIDLESYKTENLVHPLGYQMTLTAAQKAGDTLKLFYTKTDNGQNKLSAGIYLYDFNVKSDFPEGRYAFDEAKEQRITAGSAKAYTEFNFVSDTEMFATHSAGIDFLVKEDHEYKVNEDSTPVTLNWIVMKGEEVDGKLPTANITVAATYLKYVQTETEGVLYYLNGTTLQSRKLFNIAGGAKTIEINNSVNLYTMSATTTWLKYMAVGDCLYFLNSAVSNYVYYVDTTTFTAGGTTAKVKPYSNNLLSVMTEADKIALLTEKPKS